MATLYMFLYTLLISTIFADPILKPSAKWIKTKYLPYAKPTNVCHSRVINGNAKSMKLVCEDEVCDDDADTCGRKVVAYKWRNEDCDKNGEQAISIDTFRPKDKASYPYNCYEEEELNGTQVNENEFTTPYMVVRVRYGELDNVVINETTGETEEQCVLTPNKDFYRSFAAITDKCVLGWETEQGQDVPYWYKAQCNLGEDVDGDGIIDPPRFRLQKFDGLNCRNGSEIIGRDNKNVSWPVIQANGCRPEKWNDEYWWTEVTECTHPKYNLGQGWRAYNCYYNVSFIIFIIIYMIIN